MRRVVTFLTTSKAEEAIAFYRDRLGFRFVVDDGFALVFDLGNATLRINKAQEHSPELRTELGWEVDPIEAAVDDLKARGVAVVLSGNKALVELLGSGRLVGDLAPGQEETARKVVAEISALHLDRTRSEV